MPASPRRRRDVVDVLPHLQARDRALLGLLGEHRVLTTTQIAGALFSSLRMCQHRLRQLDALELVDRFGRPRSRRHGGSRPAHWTLGRLGLDLHAAAEGAAFTSARVARQTVAALAESPRLEHLLGVNGFFTDLLAHARTDPDAALVRWWSEREATRRFAGVFPDGHGLWRRGGRLVGFFLEHDTGTEDLPRLLAKLAAYERLARTGGPTYPVLFWLHSPIREANLHRLLAGTASLCPVATAARGPDRPGPAGPAWTLLGSPGPRLYLHQLPADQADLPDSGDWRRDYTTGDPAVSGTGARLVPDTRGGGF
jgi:hypothetical protein